MKLGDAIATVATPIARAANLDCIDPETNDLRPESPCAKRKAWLNRFSDKMYDVFWPPNANPTMTYIVSKQIAVEAESPEEAVAKSSSDGKTMSLTVALKPIPATPATGSAPVHSAPSAAQRMMAAAKLQA